MVKRSTANTFLFAAIAIGALMTGLVAAMGIAGFSQGACFVLFLLGIAGVALSTYPDEK